MSESPPEANTEETWDPKVARWQWEEFTKPGRFADRVVDLAERCAGEDIGADSAIGVLGAMTGPRSRAALGRLSAKPNGPAGWENAEAAQGMLLAPASRGTSH